MACAPLFVELTSTHQRGPLSRCFFDPVHPAWILVARRTATGAPLRKLPKDERSLCSALSPIQSFSSWCCSFSLASSEALFSFFPPIFLIKYRKPEVLHWFGSHPQPPTPWPQPAMECRADHELSSESRGGPGFLLALIPGRRGLFKCHGLYVFQLALLLL